MVLPKNIVVWNGVKKVIENESYFSWDVRFSVEMCESFFVVALKQEIKKEVRNPIIMKIFFI